MRQLELFGLGAEPEPLEMNGQPEDAAMLPHDATPLVFSDNKIGVKIKLRSDNQESLPAEDIQATSPIMESPLPVFRGQEVATTPVQESVQPAQIENNEPPVREFVNLALPFFADEAAIVSSSSDSATDLETVQAAMAGENIAPLNQQIAEATPAPAEDIVADAIVATENVLAETPIQESVEKPVVLQEPVTAEAPEEESMEQQPAQELAVQEQVMEPAAVQPEPPSAVEEVLETEFAGGGGEAVAIVETIAQEEKRTYSFKPLLVKPSVITIEVEEEEPVAEIAAEAVVEVIQPEAETAADVDTIAPSVDDTADNVEVNEVIAEEITAEPVVTEEREPVEAIPVNEKTAVREEIILEQIVMDFGVEATEENEHPQAEAVQHEQPILAHPEVIEPEQLVVDASEEVEPQSGIIEQTVAEAIEAEAEQEAAELEAFEVEEYQFISGKSDWEETTVFIEEDIEEEIEAEIVAEESSAEVMIFKEEVVVQEEETTATELTDETEVYEEEAYQEYGDAEEHEAEIYEEAGQEEQVEEAQHEQWEEETADEWDIQAELFEEEALEEPAIEEATEEVEESIPELNTAEEAAEVAEELEEPESDIEEVGEIVAELDVSEVGEEYKEQSETEDWEEEYEEVILEEAILTEEIYEEAAEIEEEADEEVEIAEEEESTETISDIEEASEIVSELNFSEEDIQEEEVYGEETEVWEEETDEEAIDEENVLTELEDTYEEVAGDDETLIIEEEESPVEAAWLPEEQQEVTSAEETYEAFAAQEAQDERLYEEEAEEEYEPAAIAQEVIEEEEEELIIPEEEVALAPQLAAITEDENETIASVETEQLAVFSEQSLFQSAPEEQDEYPDVIADEDIYVARTAEEKPGKREIPGKQKRGRKSLREIDAGIELLQVPEDDVLFLKQYYPISVVAGWFNVNPSLLRFWENEFTILKPRKNRKGDRLFRPEDVKNLQVIYYLLRQRKFTIEGAKEYLKTNRKKADTNTQLVQSLTRVRNFLLEFKASLLAQ